jgi:hypothetical protein
MAPPETREGHLVQERVPDITGVVLAMRRTRCRGFDGVMVSIA